MRAIIAFAILVAMTVAKVVETIRSINDESI
jgi:hypothetical protein